MLAIGLEQVVVFEMRAGGQHHICIFHRVRHDDITGDNEQVLAQKRSFHHVLVGVHDHRVVVVNKQSIDRRVEIGIEQVFAERDDIEGAGAGGDHVAAFESITGHRKSP